MRNTTRYTSLLLVLLLFTFSREATAQYDDTRAVRLVLLEETDVQALTAYLGDTYDKKQVNLELPAEDSLFRLDAFAETGGPLAGPDCFAPDLKLVFRDYTYILSLHCTRAAKFRNDAPFQPSATALENDMVFTPESYMFLYRLKREHFRKFAQPMPYTSALPTYGQPQEPGLAQDVLDMFLREETAGDEDSFYVLDGKRDKPGKVAHQRPANTGDMQTAGSGKR